MYKQVPGLHLRHFGSQMLLEFRHFLLSTSYLYLPVSVWGCDCKKTVKLSGHFPLLPLSSDLYVRLNCDLLVSFASLQINRRSPSSTCQTSETKWGKLSKTKTLRLDSWQPEQFVTQLFLPIKIQSQSFHSSLCFFTDISCCKKTSKLPVRRFFV